MNYLPDWLLWLGGTLLPLGLLWALWHLALRRERCYGYNRTLLLLAPLVAAVLPLLPRPVLPTWLASAPTLTAGPVAVLLPTVQASASVATEPTAWAGWPWLLALYGVGVALGLGKLAWQTGRLWQLARRLPRFEQGDYVLVHTGGVLPTSTFGRVVFWDETTVLAPAEATAVLAHELAHAHQRHTLDVLWLQLWRAVLWPNPFVHLLLLALRLTHELLADQAAAAPTGAAPAAPADSYATLLARLAARQLAGPAYSLLQPFAFSSTLTRIAMLQNPHPARRWKQWLVVPTLGGLLLAACQSAPSPAMVPPPPPPPPTDAQLQALESGDKIYTYVEEMPHMPEGGGQMGIVSAIQQNLKYPELTSNARQEGRVFVKFVVSPEGNVHSIEVVKGLAPAYDAAVVAAIQQLPAFVPGKQDGKPVSVSFTVPVTFQYK